MLRAGTFSKIASPGFRMTWAAGPAQVIGGHPGRRLPLAHLPRWRDAVSLEAAARQDGSPTAGWPARPLPSQEAWPGPLRQATHHMCRLLGYCSRDAAPVADLPGAEGFAAFSSLSGLDCVGWGMAWHAGSRPATWKPAIRAGGEPEYDKLAWQPLGDLGLACLRRAVPGGQPRRRSPLPLPQLRVRPQRGHLPPGIVGELLPPERERRVTGGTDGERCFLHLM